MNGISAAFKKHVKNAIKVNRFVFDFLVGKKKLPSEQPPFFQPGDKNEAAGYVLKNQFVWLKYPDLMEWIAANGKK